MRHRPILFVAFGAVAAGAVALAMFPGSGTAKLADVQAPRPVASAVTPNPDLLRRLDAEVAPPAQPAASVETVAAVEPAATPPTAIAAPSSIEPPAPSGIVDHVGSSAVNLRSGPSSSNGTIGVLQPGDQVTVASKSGGWAQVTLSDGRTGWVYSTYLANGGGNAPANTVSPSTDTPAPAPKVASTTRAVIRGADPSDLVDRTAHIGSELEAYARPSDSSQSIFTFEPGDEVRIAEVRGNWLRVETGDGTSAWIRR
jgi:uncharacterized protein YraI